MRSHGEWTSSSTVGVAKLTVDEIPATVYYPYDHGARLAALCRPRRGHGNARRLLITMTRHREGVPDRKGGKCRTSLRRPIPSLAVDSIFEESVRCPGLPIIPTVHMSMRASCSAQQHQGQVDRRRVATSGESIL